MWDYSWKMVTSPHPPMNSIYKAGHWTVKSSIEAREVGTGLLPSFLSFLKPNILHNDFELFVMTHVQILDFFYCLRNPPCIIFHSRGRITFLGVDEEISDVKYHLTPSLTKWLLINVFKIVSCSHVSWRSFNLNSHIFRNCCLNLERTQYLHDMPY